MRAPPSVAEILMDGVIKRVAKRRLSKQAPLDDPSPGNPLGDPFHRRFERGTNMSWFDNPFFASLLTTPLLTATLSAGDLMEDPQGIPSATSRRAPRWAAEGPPTSNCAMLANLPPAKERHVHVGQSTPWSGLSESWS